jgi:REP element-mobilizing transposase RayT
MRPLTHRQQAIFEFVSNFSQERGFSPSLREIGQAVGLANVSAVRGHISALEKKGYIKKEPDQPRSLSVVGSPSVMSRIRRKLHEFAKTDEGVLHKVQYGVVLATRGLNPLLHPETRDCLEEAVNHLCAEHGWRFIEKDVQPNHVVMVVEVWPNHSPELVAHRIRAATENALKRRQCVTADHVWAKGYAVTTDLEELDDIVQQFLEASR